MAMNRPLGPGRRISVEKNDPAVNHPWGGAFTILHPNTDNSLSNWCAPLFWLSFCLQRMRQRPQRGKILALKRIEKKVSKDLQGRDR